MFFRRCYSLKPVLLFAVNEKSGTLLTRIPSYTLRKAPCLFFLKIYLLYLLISNTIDI